MLNHHSGKFNLTQTKPVLAKDKFKTKPRRLEQRALYYYQKQSTIKWVRLIWLGSGLGILVVLWFLFASPFFRIDNANIDGLQRLNKSDIEALINKELQQKFLGILPVNNYFLLSGNSIKNAISNVPSIESVAVQKHFPKILTIKIIERFANIIITSNNLDYQFDLEGRAIQQMPTSTASDLPKLADTSNKQINLGEINYSKDLINLVLQVNKESDISGVKATGFKVGQDQHELIVDTSEGWQLYLSPEIELVKQEAAVDQTLKALTSEQRNRLAYIDVRLPEVTTYKLK